MNKLNKQYFQTKAAHRKSFKSRGWFIWIALLLIAIFSVYIIIQLQLLRLK